MTEPEEYPNTSTQLTPGIVEEAEETEEKETETEDVAETEEL